MPSGDLKSEFKIKKALTLISPMLIVSLGLHGLAMLLPVPEKEEIVEEEPELPEPIQVSEISELEIPEPEPAPAPTLVPAPAAATPQPAAPPPTVIVQPPAEVPQPASPPPQLPVQPSPEPAPDPAPQTAAPDPTPTGPPPTAPQIEYQPYTGNTEFDYVKSGAFTNSYGLAKDLDTPLNLIYEAEGKCYPSDDLQAWVVLLVDQYSDITDGEILKSTGIEDIDTFVASYLIDNPQPVNLPDYVFDDLPARESGNIVAWIKDTYVDLDKPLIPEGESSAPYAIKVNVAIKENRCD